VFLIRVIGLLAAVGLGVLVLLYLFTGDKRYLQYAWRLFQVVLGLVLFGLLLLFGERLLVAF
jgi:hypothetical protein